MIIQDQTSEKQGKLTWVMVHSETAMMLLGTPYPADLAL